MEETIIFFYCFFEHNSATWTSVGHDICLVGPWNNTKKDFNNPNLIWSRTSPFYMLTCRSLMKKDRTEPKDLLCTGFPDPSVCKNCGWLPYGEQVLRTPVNVTNTSGNAFQSVKIRTGIVSVVFTADGGAIRIGVDGSLPDGVSNTTSDKTLTISGSPNESGTFDYRVWASDGTDTVVRGGTITVNVDPPETSKMFLSNGGVATLGFFVASLIVGVVVTVLMLVYAHRRRRCLDKQPSLESMQLVTHNPSGYQTFDA
jgi:hypothetical protein